MKTMSSLHTAIFNERVYQIQVFLTVGMKVNTRDELGRTPLMIACFMSNRRRRETVCQLLLDHGADIDMRDKFERTILMYACATRNEFLLDQLLQYTDDDLNRVDLDGNTCLMYAAVEGDVKIIEKILEPLITYGVDLDVRNRYGLTAYLLAQKNGNTDCSKLLQNSGASFQIFDTENHWNGDKWLDLHNLLRYRQESSQYRRNTRTRSHTAQGRNDYRSDILQRPFSMPRMLSEKSYEHLQQRPTSTKAQKAWSREATSATVNLDVIALTDTNYKAPTACSEKRTTEKKAYGQNAERKTVRGAATKSTMQEDPTDKVYKSQTEAIGDYDVIVRPQTQLSARSEAMSKAGIDYGENVSTSKRSRNRGQQEQLIKIFKAYSISQVPLPPAIPGQAGKVQPLKSNGFIRRVSVDKPRKRGSSILKARGKDARYDVKAIGGIKSIPYENNVKVCK